MKSKSSPRTNNSVDSNSKEGKHWMPIDSCPIDEPVLVVVGDVVQHITYRRDFDNDWWSVECGEFFDSFDPTHWMPVNPSEASLASLITTKEKLLATMIDLHNYAHDTIWISDTETVFDRLSGIFLSAGGRQDELAALLPQYFACDHDAPSNITELVSDEIIKFVGKKVMAGIKFTLEELRLIFFMALKVGANNDNDCHENKIKAEIGVLCEFLGNGLSELDCKEAIEGLMSKALTLNENHCMLQVAFIVAFGYDKNKGFVVLSFNPELRTLLLNIKKIGNDYC